MTKDEALKLALNYLWEHKKGAHIIAAIREALAQPEQEPVAWLTKHKHSGEFDFDDPNSEETQSWSASFPVYTTPPLRSNYE